MRHYPSGWFVARACEGRKRGLALVPSDDYRVTLTGDGSHARLMISVVSDDDRLLIFDGEISSDSMVRKRPQGFIHDGPWVVDLIAHYIAMEDEINAIDGRKIADQPPWTTPEDLQAARISHMRDRIRERRGNKIDQAEEDILDRSTLKYLGGQ